MFLFFREVDVIIVRLTGEVFAEAVERRPCSCAAHPRHLVIARETVTPAEYGQTSQHLQQLSGKHIQSVGVHSTSWTLCTDALHRRQRA